MLKGLALIVGFFVTINASANTSSLKCNENACSRILKSCATHQLSKPQTNISPATANNMNGTDNKILWQSYSSNMFEGDKNKNHPVIMFTRSSACPWSIKMERTTLSNPNIISTINNNFIPVIIDFDTNTALAEQYKIINLPTLIVFSSDGKPLKTYSGFIELEEMQKLLNSVAK
jgi:thioredoxin-related protein